MNVQSEKERHLDISEGGKNLSETVNKEKNSGNSANNVSI